ncbi:DUF1819 family protein [Paenibacillus sp. FSL L8-0709]|uniref:DUF1819 family protein n=1 Tax=Paenibacillus sp. FSL L8-0709 TaxID=2975312 RepID=UPI0030F75BAA
MNKGVERMSTNPYSATLTGASFMFYEFKQVISLKEQGLEENDIRNKIINENLFQYKFTSSLKRSMPSVIRRVAVLDDVLRRIVLEDTLETGKAVNLYAIMKTDRLFFEFMTEVIHEKFESNNYLLEKKDINHYMTTKAEQDSEVAKWTEQTVNKLKNVIQLILIEAGILKDKKTGELSRLLIDEQLKGYLIQIGEIIYVKAMGEV